MKCKQCNGDISIVRNSHGVYELICKACGTAVAPGTLFKHVTNFRITMSYVFCRNYQTIVCNWVDTIGVFHTQDFLLAELYFA